jgi:hypothetical protein
MNAALTGLAIGAVRKPFTEEFVDHRKSDSIAPKTIITTPFTHFATGVLLLSESCAPAYRAFVEADRVSVWCASRSHDFGRSCKNWGVSPK